MQHNAASRMYLTKKLQSSNNTKTLIMLKQNAIETYTLSFLTELKPVKLDTERKNDRNYYFKKF